MDPIATLNQLLTHDLGSDTQAQDDTYKALLALQYDNSAQTNIYLEDIEARFPNFYNRIKPFFAETRLLSALQTQAIRMGDTAPSWPSKNTTLEEKTIDLLRYYILKGSAERKEALHYYAPVLKRYPEIASQIVDELLPNQHNAQAICDLLETVGYQEVDTPKIINAFKSWLNWNQPESAVAIRRALWKMGNRDHVEEALGYYANLISSAERRTDSPKAILAALDGLMEIEEAALPILPKLQLALEETQGELEELLRYKIKTPGKKTAPAEVDAFLKYQEKSTRLFSLYGKTRKAVCFLQAVAARNSHELSTKTWEVGDIPKQLKNPWGWKKLQALRELEKLTDAETPSAATGFDQETIDALISVIKNPGTFIPTLRGNIRLKAIALLGRAGATGQKAIPDLIPHKLTPIALREAPYLPLVHALGLVEWSVTESWDDFFARPDIRKATNTTLRTLIAYADKTNIGDLIEMNRGFAGNPRTGFEAMYLAAHSVHAKGLIDRNLRKAEIKNESKERKSALIFLYIQETILDDNQHARLVTTILEETYPPHRSLLLMILGRQYFLRKKKGEAPSPETRLASIAIQVLRDTVLPSKEDDYSYTTQTRRDMSLAFLAEYPHDSLRTLLSSEDFSFLMDYCEKYCRKYIRSTKQGKTRRWIENVLTSTDNKLTTEQFTACTFILGKQGQEAFVLQQVQDIIADQLRLNIPETDLGKLQYAAQLAVSLGPKGKSLIPNFQQLYIHTNTFKQDKNNRQKLAIQIRLLAAGTLLHLIKESEADASSPATSEPPPTKGQETATTPHRSTPPPRGGQNLTRTLVTVESSSDHLAQNVATRLAEALREDVDLTGVDVDTVLNIQEALENGSPQIARAMLARIGIHLSTNAGTPTTQTNPNNNAAVEALYGGALTFASPAMTVAL